MNTQIIAIASQKGGVGKTTTCANLGISLVQAGKKVLLIDGDPQGSLTISLGNPQPDKLPFTLSDAILMDGPIRPGEGILHHPEGVDLMPADIQLSGMEVSLVNSMSRETILRQYLDTLKGQYSHILIDCQLFLGRGSPVATAEDESSAAPTEPAGETAHSQCAGRCEPDHNSRSGGVPARQRAGTATLHGKQGKAADQPQAPDRRYPADNGGQSNQLCQRDLRAPAGDLWQQDQGIRHRDFPFCPGKGNQRRGKKHFCP